MSCWTPTLPRRRRAVASGREQGQPIHAEEWAAARCDSRSPRAVVTHMVWYHVGGTDDPPGLSGEAHLFEL